MMHRFTTRTSHYESFAVSGAGCNDNVGGRGALQAGVGPGLQLHFPDAPHPAAGPPPADVAAHWPGQPTFEWCYRGRHHYNPYRS